METILVFDQINAGYGKTRVLKDLSFSVKRGEVFGIIGPNGSGKTTMLNVLTGLVQPTSGAVRLDGKDISSLPVHERCCLGIGRTFQIPRPFIRMSVYENVFVSAVYGTRLPIRNGREPVLDVLKATGLDDKKDLLAGKLTLLDRKRLEIARAVVSRPKLLLLDEVTAGLTVAETTDIIAMMRHLKEAGFTILWIEHVLETMRSVSDRLMCLSEGQCAVLGPTEEVLASPVVAELYLGTEREKDGHAAD